MKEAGMSRKGFTVEKIIGMLREAEVALAQGRKVGEMCRSLCRLMAYERSGFVFMLACPGLSHSGNNVLEGSDHGGSQDYRACKPNDQNLYIHDVGSFSSSPVARFARRQKSNLRPTRKFPFCHLPHL
jgi:hypothetical protein